MVSAPERPRESQIGASDPVPVVQYALGDLWDALPPEVQALHRFSGVARFVGTADVTRGRSLLARLTARLVGFPPSGRGLTVTVTKTRTAQGEVWERDFGGQRFRSICSPSPRPGHMCERLGAMTFELELPVRDGAMHLPVRHGWIFGLPLPGWMLPKSDSREYAQDRCFHFDVAVSAPFGGGLIVRYRGTLRPVPEA